MKQRYLLTERSPLRGHYWATNIFELNTLPRFTNFSDKLPSYSFRLLVKQK